MTCSRFCNANSKTLGTRFRCLGFACWCCWRAGAQAPGVVGAAMPMMGVMAPLSAKMNAAMQPEIIAEKDTVIAELRETNQVGAGVTWCPGGQWVQRR